MYTADEMNGARVGDVERGAAIDAALDWFADKGHPIVFSATLRTNFDARIAAGCGMTAELGSRWVCEAFHIALSINKAHKGMKGNKGKSILVFDQGSGYERKLSELLVSPPAWSDTYYSKPRKKEQLEQIMDTSFFADSVHAPLIQIADAIAFIVRRLAEIRDAGHAERFKGELANLEGWLTKLEPNLKYGPHRYKKTGRCKCGDLFWDLAPASLHGVE
jgi:hypothetical protein